MSHKPDEWMPLHVRKYLGDTTHLTRDQHGAYFLLLMAYWMRGGPLPDDDSKLAAICKATKAEWKRLRAVLAEFFTIADGVWSQKRADEELATARSIMAAKSEAGKAGAAARWQKDADANGKRMADASGSQWQTDAPLPKPIPKQEVAAATVGQETADQLNRLNKILGFDELNHTAFAANIRTLFDLKAEKCDFTAHILPAAEQAAKTGRAKTLAYIRPKALELRDAAKLVASMPVPFEPTDDRGWADRARVWRERQQWHPKWGPPPDQPDCKCPAHILNSEAA